MTICIASDERLERAGTALAAACPGRSGLPWPGSGSGSGSWVCLHYNYGYNHHNYIYMGGRGRGVWWQGSEGCSDAATAVRNDASRGVVSKQTQRIFPKIPNSNRNPELDFAGAAVISDVVASVSASASTSCRRVHLRLSVCLPACLSTPATSCNATVGVCFCPSGSQSLQADLMLAAGGR